MTRCERDVHVVLVNAVEVWGGDACLVVVVAAAAAAVAFSHRARCKECVRRASDSGVGDVETMVVLGFVASNGRES